jgi:hypothetical protein
MVEHEACLSILNSKEEHRSKISLFMEDTLFTAESNRKK